MKIQLVKHDNKTEVTAGKVVCIGRNYAAHAKELNNSVPTVPLLFMKPATALVDVNEALRIPENAGQVHHECEVALLIGHSFDSNLTVNILDNVVGVGLALDLTLRDLQNELKSQGHPWERAKAFDGACPISEFVSTEQIDWNKPFEFELQKNGEQQQKGNTQDMLWSFADLLGEINKVFSLNPGDIVLTGTPAGVSALRSGDQLFMRIWQQDDLLSVKTEVS